MWMVAISNTVINKFPSSHLLKVKRNSTLEKQLKLTLASDNTLRFSYRYGLGLLSNA